MGLNAYFAYTVVLQMGYTWQMALAAVFVEGLIFIALSLTNVREAIFNAIPMNLKHAVSAGIGLFIAFIGLQNAKIVVESATLVSVFSFKGSLEAGTFNSVGITVLLALVGVLITAVFCCGPCVLAHSHRFVPSTFHYRQLYQMHHVYSVSPSSPPSIFLSSAFALDRCVYMVLTFLCRIPAISTAE